MKIQNIQALEVLDSRGFPTVEVNIEIGNEFKKYRSKSVVPSLAMNEDAEVKELRDSDKKRYLGMGVSKAVTSINTFIAKALYNHDFKTLEELDRYLVQLDGTVNKSNLGSNSLLGISMAFLRAIAKLNKQKPFEYISKGFGNSVKLPLPAIRLLENDKLGIIIISKKSENTFVDNIKILAEIYHSLSILDSEIDIKNYIEQLKDIAGEFKYTYGEDFEVIVECKSEIDLATIPVEDVVAVYFRDSKNHSYDRVTILDANKIKDAEHKKTVGVLEVDNIGTLTETFDVIRKFKNNGVKTMITHSKSDTEDNLISHIIVGSSAEYVLFDGLVGSEVSSIINELIRIEHYIADNSSICL